MLDRSENDAPGRVWTQFKKNAVPGRRRRENAMRRDKMCNEWVLGGMEEGNGGKKSVKLEEIDHPFKWSVWIKGLWDKAQIYGKTNRKWREWLRDGGQSVRRSILLWNDEKSLRIWRGGEDGKVWFVRRGLMQWDGDKVQKMAFWVDHLHCGDDGT